MTASFSPANLHVCQNSCKFLRQQNVYRNPANKFLRPQVISVQKLSPRENNTLLFSRFYLQLSKIRQMLKEAVPYSKLGRIESLWTGESDYHWPAAAL